MSDRAFMGPALQLNSPPSGSYLTKARSSTPLHAILVVLGCGLGACGLFLLKPHLAAHHFSEAGGWVMAGAGLVLVAFGAGLYLAKRLSKSDDGMGMPKPRELNRFGSLVDTLPDAEGSDGDDDAVVRLSPAGDDDSDSYDNFSKVYTSSPCVHGSVSSS